MLLISKKHVTSYKAIITRKHILTVIHETYSSWGPQRPF